jgi:hypothetical protein
MALYSNERNLEFRHGDSSRLCPLDSLSSLNSRQYSLDKIDVAQAYHQFYYDRSYQDRPLYRNLHIWNLSIQSACQSYSRSIYRYSQYLKLQYQG